ncbi:MAG: hypothetical protein JSS98_01215 [Bacteroidetes bacterium]|nr:hypothetical protein [Bacteroidota bacterium]
MDLLDFFVFVLYTLLFYFYFSLSRKRITDIRLRKFHKNAFWLKVFASLCYSLFVLYISLGDTTTLYFPEGHHLYKLILNDPSKFHLLFMDGHAFDSSMLDNPHQIGYFSDTSNLLVIKFTAFLSFFTFGQYLTLNLTFSMIAFSGVWKLYRFFCMQFPELKKQFAIAILYLPTFVFWSSGILKEPFVISALGWLTYALYQVMYKRKKIVINSCRVFICIYIFTLVKIYILVAYLPAFALFLLLKNASLIKNIFGKILLIIGFMAGSIFFFTRVADNSETLEGYTGNDLTKNIIVRQQNFNAQNNASEGSFFSLGVTFDGSLGSLIKIAPAAIIATLFRPFIWESRNISTMLSSIESMAFMFFTIFVFFKVGASHFFNTIVRKPIVLYCFVFSMIFSLFVGATTLNFGTLVRYKIPATPFYLIALILILYYSAESQKRKQHLISE